VVVVPAIVTGIVFAFVCTAVWVVGTVVVEVAVVVAGIVVVEVVVVGTVEVELLVVEAVVPERFDSRRRRLVSSRVRLVAFVPATAASVIAAEVSPAPPHPELINESVIEAESRLIRKTGLCWLIEYSLIQ
jgi:hypothetical protein